MRSIHFTSAEWGRLMADQYFRDWPTIIRRAFFEAILPLIGGCVTVLVAWWQSSSLLAAMSGFGIGYLFVLSAQAQVLRIAKNVRDEGDAEEFRDSFASIHQAIRELRARGITVHAEQPTTQVHPEIPEPPEGAIFSLRPVSLGFNNFLMQARAAMASGQHYAAVILAAIGFEHAARNAADQLGIDSYKQSLGRLLRELAHRTETEKEGALETFMTLSKLRNSIVHGEREYTDISRDSAEDLINGFIVGANYLEMAA